MLELITSAVKNFFNGTATILIIRIAIYGTIVACTLNQAGIVFEDIFFQKLILSVLLPYALYLKSKAFWALLLILLLWSSRETVLSGHPSNKTILDPIFFFVSICLMVFSCVVLIIADLEMLFLGSTELILICFTDSRSGWSVLAMFFVTIYMYITSTYGVRTKSN